MAGDAENREEHLAKFAQGTARPSSPDDGGVMTETNVAVFDSTSSKYLSQNYRRAAGAGYVVATGVCGIVLVALSSSLKDLAAQVGKTSIEVGAVFLTRGIGAALGNVVSSKLYRVARGKAVVSATLILLAATLLCTPFADVIGILHLNFFGLGFLTAIVDAGCQLMTLRLHGSAAGPWLGANTIAFGLSGAISPLIGWLTGSPLVEYAILAAVTFCIAFFLVVLPSPDIQPPAREEQIQLPELALPAGFLRPLEFYVKNKIDFLLCGLMFWFMGGRVAATAFLRQFADDTSQASNSPLVVVMLWLAITSGRIIGLRDQLTLILARLYRHMAMTCIGGAASMLALAVFNQSVVVLWFSVVIFGLFDGPTLGYGYDLSTRVSPNPVTSTLVASFGITAGASIVPFLASFTWDITGWPLFLPLCVLASHAVPFLLLRRVKKLCGVASSVRKPLETGDDISAAPPTPSFGAPPSPTADVSQAGSDVDEEEMSERAIGSEYARHSGV